MANVKGNALTAKTTVALTDIIIVVDPTTGVAYRTTAAQFITSKFGAENATTAALTESDLNTAYPGVSFPFQVACPSITDGPMIYVKITGGWRSYPLGTV